MIKDENYYMSIAMDCVSQAVKDSPQTRANDKLWGDLLAAIFLRSRYFPVPIEKVRLAVGEPDKIATVNDGGEKWTYNWIGKHGANSYTSSTSFDVRQGSVVGIVGSQDGE